MTTANLGVSDDVKSSCVCSFVQHMRKKFCLYHENVYLKNICWRTLIYL